MRSLTGSSRSLRPGHPRMTRPLLSLPDIAPKAASWINESTTAEARPPCSTYARNVTWLSPRCPRSSDTTGHSTTHRCPIAPASLTDDFMLYRVCPHVDTANKSFRHGHTSADTSWKTTAVYSGCKTKAAALNPPHPRSLLPTPRRWPAQSPHRTMNRTSPTSPLPRLSAGPKRPLQVQQ